MSLSDEIRTGVSSGIVIFLVILTILDLIALLPGYFIVQSMVDNPDITQFAPQMTKLGYWIIYFLLQHIVTLPLSIILTMILNRLNTPGVI